MFKKEIITVGIILGIVLTIVLIITFIVNHNSAIDEKHKKISFKGVIIKIEYDDKKIPTVVLTDSSYYLGSYAYIGICEILKVNDSIVKEPNTLDYILYRKDSNETWQLIYGQP